MLYVCVRGVMDVVVAVCDAWSCRCSCMGSMSLPSGYCMCAFAGFTLVNSTSSTSGSFLLFRTNRLNIRLPVTDIQFVR